MDYKTIFKKIVLLILIALGIFISAKLFMFYIPFLIAYIISLLVDPIIKFINKKTNLSRKTSSIIVLATVFLLLIGLFSWGVIILISESTHLLGALNTYLEKAIFWSNNIFRNYNLDKLSLPQEVKDLIQSTSTEILNKIIDLVKSILNNILEYLKSIPTILIYTVITILATYFITSDKFYILDRLEHHIPKKVLWIITEKIQKICKSLGEYLKAEVTMIGISFVIVLMGLNIFYLMGMNVGYPLLMALFISFVDALPILGAGTIMLPWSLILFFNKEYSVSTSILGLYIFVIAVRQFIGPKIVSNKIGVHPIFTLIAMYTGFKFLGIIGILVGPIVLIILKNIFENSIDKGIVKTILEE